MGDGGAGKREAQRNREILAEEKLQFEKAQELLGKSKDEAISDIDAAEARAQGLITDTQEAVITRLNQTEAGAIETLRDFDERTRFDLEQAETDVLDTILTTSILASDEFKAGFGKSIEELNQTQRDVLTDLTDSGLLEREALSDANIKAISDISGFSDQAIEALAPFKEQGERSLLQARVLSGTATQQERQDFEERFGPVEISPIAQARIEEEERAIGRQQQALGRRFSGLGQEEILERGSRRITGEEFGRQLETAQDLARLGFGASSQEAGIRQRQGETTAQLRAALGPQLAQSFQRQQQLGLQQRAQLGQQRAGLQSQLGQLLAQNLQRQQSLQVGAQQQFGITGAQLGQQLGANIGNVQAGFGTQAANVLNQIGVNRVNLASQLGGARANVRLGQDVNIANLIARSAEQQAQGLIGASELQRESETSVLRDISGVLGTGATILGTALGGPAVGGAIGTAVR